jgi:hypothetical protein
MSALPMTAFDPLRTMEHAENTKGPGIPSGRRRDTSIGAHPMVCGQIWNFMPGRVRARLPAPHPPA